MSNLENLEQEFLEGKILYRSITPMPSCWLASDADLPSISGIQDGGSYRVYLAYSNGWKQAESGLLKFWSYDQLCRTPELIEQFAVGNLCNQFLVVDHIVDVTNETRISSNSMASVKLHAAAVNALILHHGAQGPYMEDTWQLQFPLLGIGRARSLVSMNRFLCPSTTPTSLDKFSTTFQALLTQPWEDSQFERILDLALDTLSGSLRTLKPAHSFALLAMTFEILFTKSENDFSGGSKRLARLTGNTKGEVTSLQRFLDSGEENCVRKLRNRVIHGNESIDYSELKPIRHKFSGLLAQAMIFLIQYFATHVATGNYYERIENVANDRFTYLPSQ